MTALSSHSRQFATVPVCHDIQVNGQLVGLHDSGALWWPEEATLVVSDMHLEKGSSYARRGTLLPRAPQETGGQRSAKAAIRGNLHPVTIAAFLVAVL